MPNSRRFHLADLPQHIVQRGNMLATPAGSNGISRLMQSVGGGYVRSFNDRQNRTGTLWDGRFFSSLVGSDHYLWSCYRYIELNPVRAGIVDAPGEFRWSSHGRNAYGRPDPVVTPPESEDPGKGSTSLRDRERRRRVINSDLFFVARPSSRSGWRRCRRSSCGSCSARSRRRSSSAAVPAGPDACGSTRPGTCSWPNPWQRVHPGPAAP